MAGISVHFAASVNGTAGGYNAPVSATRTGFGGDDTLVPSMFPGGRRASNNNPVYIAVEPALSQDGTFYEYPVPDVTGVLWTEGEFNQRFKTIGSITYKMWGYHRADSAGWQEG